LKKQEKIFENSCEIRFLYSVNLYCIKLCSVIYTVFVKALNRIIFPLNIKKYHHVNYVKHVARLGFLQFTLVFEQRLLLDNVKKLFRDISEAAEPGMARAAENKRQKSVRDF